MSKTEKPLINKQYLLEKYPGKGGWTYAAIPEIPQDKKAPFGWVKVRGKIDHFEINNYRLMPMGNGQLFLPVKADIRKKIGKKEGEWITVVLYADNRPPEIPEELKICLKDAALLDKFSACSDGEQKAFIDWIESAKQDSTKVNRIRKTIFKLESGIKFNENKK